MPDPDHLVRSAGAAIRRAFGAAGLALAFLTVIPVRLRDGGRPLGDAAAWLPVVGALVGGLAGLTRYYGEPLFGPAVASVLAVIVLVGVTGGLHQDGLADCADGLGVRGDRERRLAVMRDSAIGTFGALALIGWALLLVTALSTLSDADALRALVIAAIVGRWAALAQAAVAPQARPDGLGARFAVRRSTVALASATSAGAAVLLLGLLHGLAVFAAGAFVALLVTSWTRRALGGRTGDTLGATVAIVEVAVCLTALALASVV